MSFPVLSCDSVAAFYTLGCKLNQLESEAIAAAFAKEGFAVMPWNENMRLQKNTDAVQKPEILIINTCTVTSKSEQKARRIIRNALRDTSLKLVIVTGCYAQVEAAALESLDFQSRDTAGSARSKRLYVIPQDKKYLLLQLPQGLRRAGVVDLFTAITATETCNDRISPAESYLAGSSQVDTSFCYNPEQFNFHSRAFVKIQDGCDNKCAFCRTSIARGRSRSLEAEKILAVIKALEDKGHKEAVLTGVNISQYCDGKSCSGLPALLEYLITETSNIRIRLSSIEPEIINPDFIRAASHNRIRPHFHISMQSGSRAVLERMKRFYDPDQVLESIKLLRTVKDDPFVGCDIIAGFPGETEKDFEKTFVFCHKAGFAGIHVFPFSKRPGTDAWNMTEHRVTERETGLRVKTILGLALKQKQAYIKRWIGREIEAIMEEDTVKLSGFSPAMSANYLKLLVKASDAQELKPGKAYNCQVVSAIDSNSNIPKSKGYDAVAEII